MLALAPLKRFLDFSGRSGRAEFWQWTMLTVVVNWILRFIDYAAASAYAPPSHTLSLLFVAVTFIPSVAVTFRRLHDIGRSGWLYGALVGLCTFVGFVIGFGLALRQQIGSDFLFDIGILLALLSVAPIIYFIVLLATKGDPQPNAYGPPDAFAASAPPIGTYLNELQARMSAGAPPTAANQLEALERLGRMRDQGLLTEEEFAAQKRRLLGTQDVPPAQ